MNKLLIFVLATFCVFSSFAQANDSKNGAFGMSAGEKLLVYETSKQDRSYQVSCSPSSKNFKNGTWITKKQDSWKNIL